MTENKTNFPEPKTAADRIVMKAIELLEADTWQSLNDNYITFNDVKISVDTNTAHVLIATDGAIVLRKESPDRAIADAFMEAYFLAMARRRDRLLLRQVKDIANENYNEEKRQAELERAKRQERREMIEIGQFIGVVVIGLLVVGGGITSCVIASGKSAKIEAAKVNTFGFRKGDLDVHLDYPRSCSSQDATRGRGLNYCKDVMARWESEGAAWIEWDD